MARHKWKMDAMGCYCCTQCGMQQVVKQKPRGSWRKSVCYMVFVSKDGETYDSKKTPPCVP